MYFLDCAMTGDVKPVFAIVGWVVTIIQWGIPLALIVLGMLDLGKAVISSKDDEVKKAKKAFGRRLLYAVLVFLVVWGVQVVFTVVGNLFKGNSEVTGITDWKGCWQCIVSKGKETGGCKYTGIQ